jgi:hypothetical protein
LSSAGKTTRIGAAVFAVGLSLAGPQAIGTASADGGESGAVSADSAHQGVDSGQAGNQAAKAAATRAGGAAGRRESQVPAAAAEAAQSTPVSGAAQAASQPEANGDVSRRSTQPQAARTARAPRAAHRDRAGDAAQSDAFGPVQPRIAVAQPVTTPATDTAATPASTSAVPAPPIASAVTPARALAVASLPTVSAAATGDIFSTLFGPIGSLFEGIALLIRRTFFNQAPTVDPVQLTGQTTGLITGTLNAVDPEGDPLIFEVIDAPANGEVSIGPDGGFVYTPGQGFTGRDSFNVAVTDTGFHINLLDPLRPASTEAYTQVAQNAVAAMLTFSFAYGTGSQYWTAEARDALEASASRLAAYIVVTTPTMLAYTVTAERSPSSSTLASAGSDLSGTGSGFFPTVVQEKILTGIDPNGSTADGDIDWNFGNPWAYGTLVSNSQYDFTSTAMHELLHTFGFLSYTDEAGYNTGRSWTTFDQFIVTSDGTRVISDTYRFNTAYNSNLTGGNGGLYFAGPNAVAAYGSYVPLYTPRPWEAGSSTSHLDDDTFTGSNAQLMNAVTDTGLGVRVLSPIELGILADLGYTVTDSPIYAIAVIGFIFLRRRDRAAA